MINFNIIQNQLVYYSNKTLFKHAGWSANYHAMIAPKNNP
jgi:hypothetical protein